MFRLFQAAHFYGPGFFNLLTNEFDPLNCLILTELIWNSTNQTVSMACIFDERIFIPILGPTNEVNSELKSGLRIGPKTLNRKLDPK